MPPNETHKPEAWEKIVATITAAFVVGFICFLVVRDKPFADANLTTMSRILLSLACAVLGAVIPGFLHVSLTGGGAAIRAGGALALFAITYFFSPTVVLPTNLSPVSAKAHIPPEADAVLSPKDAVIRTPREIISEIDSRPPFQREEIASHYVGQHVRWLVTFSSARRSGPDKVYLTFRDRGRYPWVYCEVRLSEYPWIQTVQENTELYLVGTISKVGDNTLTLTDATLEQKTGA